MTQSYAQPVLIDLGDVSAMPAPVDDDQAPRLRPRTFLVAAVAMIAALLPAAAGAPAPPPFDPAVRVSLPATAYTLVDGSLYTVSAAGLLAAYALPGGTLRWTSRVHIDGPFQPTRIGDLLLVTSAGTTAQTSVLDATTGTVRWQRRGTPIFTDQVDGATVLIAPPDPVEGAPDPELGSLVAVGLADGTTRWTFPASGSGVHMTPVYGELAQGPVQIVGLLHSVGADQRLLDLATGRDTAVPPVGQRGPLEFGEGASQALVDGMIVVADTSPLALRAYDRTTMRPLWTTMLGESVGSTAGCGPWLCATTRSGTAALDPHTGAVAWRTDWFALSAGDRDRSVAFRIQANGPLGVAVLQTATGQVLLSITDWRPLRLGYARKLPLLRASKDGRVELAVLDVEHGATHRLGELHTTASDPCDADQTYLVCRTAPGQLQLWRYAG